MRWHLGVLLAASVAMPCAAGAGDYAPLNCAKAGSAAERTICGSYALGQAEARMATLFGIATSLVAMGERGALKDEQRAWLKEREACGTRIGCLTRRYDARIKTLSGVIDGVAAHGPF
jgi:uncharacterized protein